MTGKESQQRDGAGVQVALGAAQGGHTFPVQALVVASPFLFSADWKGCLKVRLPKATVRARKPQYGHENICDQLQINHCTDEVHKTTE